MIWQNRPVVIAEDPDLGTDIASLIQAQAAAGAYEISVWAKREAIKQPRWTLHRIVEGPGWSFSCSHSAADCALV